MSFLDNPFLRGYWNLEVQRLLEIIIDRESSPILRPLVPLQTLLSNDRIAQKSCLLGNGYAVITEGQRIPKTLRAQCDQHGFVIAVRYAIRADDRGQPVYLGNVPSFKQANEIIQRMRFEAGSFNRCWEISAWHLDRAALRYLEDLADAKPPLGPFFYAFRLPNDAIGVKLIDTPWNDEHLKGTCGTTIGELWQAHLAHGMPKSLLYVLHLAGEADVRFLVFDGGRTETRCATDFRSRLAIHPDDPVFPDPIGKPRHFSTFHFRSNHVTNTLPRRYPRRRPSALRHRAGMARPDSAATHRYRRLRHRWRGRGRLDTFFYRQYPDGRLVPQ
jgi:hypothetical protein